MDIKFQKALETACGRIVMRSPFISSILLSTEIVVREDLPFAAGTDSDSIFLNPPKVLEMLKGTSLTLSKMLETIFAHECMHIALLHIGRQGNRKEVGVDPAGNKVSLWNIAADYVINPSLVVDGYSEIPGWAITNEINAVEMSVEEVYDWLLKKVKQNPSKPVAGEQFDELMEESEGESTSDQKEAKELRTRMKVQQALEVAKAMGRIPSSLERYVKEAMQPKVDWREELRNTVVSTFKKEDYTWSRLNRKFIWDDVYLPGMVGNETGPVLLAFDTSGSIGERELSCFLAEMNSIFEECNPSEIIVLFCDSEVKGKHLTLDEGDLPLEVKQFNKICKGGGGTAFSPVFRYVKDHNLHPDMLIYFTDLCCNDFGNEPNCPVVWVSTEDSKAPFGKVIKIEV